MSATAYPRRERASSRGHRYYWCRLVDRYLVHHDRENHVCDRIAHLYESAFQSVEFQMR